MVVGTCPVLVLKEQVQVADLVQHHWEVNDAGAVDLVQLLDGVLFLQIEAENGVELLASTADTSDQQDLGGGNLHGLKATDRHWDLQSHGADLLLGQVKFLYGVESAFIAMIASENEDSGVIE